MLSQTAEYALRAVIYLARQGPGATVRAETIANALGAPVNYMSKTLYALAKAGLVEGMRGPTGGFRLKVDPETVSVAQVVNTFDERARTPICLLGDRPCTSANPCLAHFRWLAVTEAMKAPLRDTMLADLLDE
jgi:Rrf2 family protein